MNKENTANILIGIGVACIFIAVLYFVNSIYQIELVRANECVKARELYFGDNNTEGIQANANGFQEGCLITEAKQ